MRGCCGEDLSTGVTPANREGINSKTETFESFTKADRGFQDSTVKVVEGVMLQVKEAWRVQQSHQGLSRALKSRTDPHNRGRGDAVEPMLTSDIRVNAATPSALNWTAS